MGHLGPTLEIPRALAIPTLPKCLSKPATVNLTSEAPDSGRNGTRNLPRMPLSLREFATVANEAGRGGDQDQREVRCGTFSLVYSYLRLDPGD